MILYHSDIGLTEALLDQRYTKRYLAEGDSWFSIGGYTGNLLMALDDPTTLIVNCAYPGDTMDSIAGMGGYAFSRMLELDGGIRPWDAVLLSAGGNDLLGRCARFVVPDPSDPIDDIALIDVMSDIERNIKRMLRLCDAIQPGVPVLMHTYDYPPVSRRWRWWQPGPWVSPVFKSAGVARDRWNDFARMLIDMLADRLRAVSTGFHTLAVVDTRGRLTDRDWRNEIHPTSSGYAKHIEPWRRTLAAAQQQMGDRA